MLRKIYRLPANIKLAHSKSKDLNAFVVKIAQNQLSFPRFAFVISKKVDKRATVRNKIKRKMTEAVGEILTEVGNIDAIFILKRSSVENIENLSSLVKQSLLK